MKKRYCLADYILSIDPDDSNVKAMFGTISVGGEGSYTESMTITMDATMWTTTGYATGGWTHDKSLAKNGTVQLSLNQLSDQVAKFKQLCNVYYAGDYEGLTMTLSDIDGNKVCTCIDCYIQKIPEQSFGNSAANQTWTITCGKIVFN